jgi:hypothetical protein
MIMNKLATGITAIAIATTAISVPAKADNKDLTKLLAVLAGGLVIHEIVDKKKDRKAAEASAQRERHKKPRDKRITHQHRNGEWYTHRNMEELRHYHSKKGRYERRHRRTDKNRLAPPVQDRFFQLSMPNRCERTLSGRFGQTKHGMSRRCLRKFGYIIEKNGRVTHPNHPNRAARPTLF